MGSNEAPLSQYVAGLLGLGIIMPVFFFILIFFFFIYIKCIKPRRAKSLSEMIKKNVVVRLDNGKVARVHDGKEIRNGAFIINKNEIVRLVDGKIVKMHEPTEITSSGILSGFLIGSAPLGLDPIDTATASTSVFPGHSGGYNIGDYTNNSHLVNSNNLDCLGDYNCGGNEGDFSIDFGGVSDCGGADCSFAFGGE